jgi:hypothetical protein
MHVEPREFGAANGHREKLQLKTLIAPSSRPSHRPRLGRWRAWASRRVKARQERAHRALVRRAARSTTRVTHRHLVLAANDRVGGRTSKSALFLFLRIRCSDRSSQWMRNHPPSPTRNDRVLLPPCNQAETIEHRGTSMPGEGGEPSTTNGLHFRWWTCSLAP